MLMVFIIASMAMVAKYDKEEGGYSILIRKYLQKIYLALIFIILYAPIVTLIILSFNQSKTRAKWGGFTLKWYEDLLKNEQIMSAFYTTLIIAFVSAADCHCYWYSSQPLPFRA